MTSVVIFKVLDTGGNPINKKVNFSLNTTVGGLSLTTASADSDADGLVQTIVQAGTASTPVRVSATIDGTAISTVSDNLVVSTGIPDQKSISIAASTLNIEGWDYDGVTSDVTVRLGDHFNNPVPDGTAVQFRTSGASIQPSCTTTSGACTVKFTSQNPRPASGRAVVLSYALGEESFVDLNGNGVYDPGTDTYTDMAEPFLDANENSLRDATEEFVDTNADGLYSPGDGIFNGILRNASITGSKTIHVRNSLSIVLSGSNPVITVNNGVAIQLDVCTTGVAFANTPTEFEVIVEDRNGNVMPAGTTIDFSTDHGTILTNKAYIVPSTSAISPPTYSVQIKSDATQGAAPGLTCTNAIKNGVFTVTVKTPKGVETYRDASVQD